MSDDNIKARLRAQKPWLTMYRDALAAIEALEADVARLQAEAGKVNVVMDRLCREAAEASDMAETLRAQLAQREAAIEALEARIANLIANSEWPGGRIAELKAQLAQRDAEIRVMSGQLLYCRRRIAMAATEYGGRVEFIAAHVLAALVQAAAHDNGDYYAERLAASDAAEAAAKFAVALVNHIDGLELEASEREDAAAAEAKYLP